jgi:beta-xylosidase
VNKPSTISGARRLCQISAIIVVAMFCSTGTTQPSAATSAPRTLTAIDDLPTQGQWGDQGDGTYDNPVLPADFSDLDAIAVGDRFYAISSTMQYSPGMTVLESKDLVNWKIIGGVVPDLTILDPELNWDRMNRAGRGIWAGAIRYHAGRFWVYFTTPDQGIFMSTAKDAAGPWTTAVPVMAVPGWDDTCPFWDDDGQMYLVTTHFAAEGPNATKYNIHLFNLTADGKSIVPGSDHIIHQSRGSEANKLYKWNGLYYHYYSEVRPEGRVAMMDRAKSLDGPWESRQIIHVQGAIDKEPNQGGIVQAPGGKWWFFTHQGRGDWEGRAAVLLPVTWVDGWPVLGKVGEDGIGGMVWRGTKPVQKQPQTAIVVNDDFNAPTLKPKWQWNYQPRAGMWSLTERKGFLRLHAFTPLKSGDLKTVGDVLTQRAFRSRHNEVTVKLDVSGMVDGQEAGLSHFARTSAMLGVVQTGKTRTLSVNENGARESGPSLKQPAVWLRSTWGFDGISIFSYSLDGKTFTPIGDPYQLTWGSYRGDRIGLFTQNPDTAGYADFDSVQYVVDR